HEMQNLLGGVVVAVRNPDLRTIEGPGTVVTRLGCSENAPDIGTRLGFADDDRAGDAAGDQPRHPARAEFGVRILQQRQRGAAQVDTDHAEGEIGAVADFLHRARHAEWKAKTLVFKW